MEEKVFPRAAVAAELEHYIEARLHTDGLKNIAEIKRLQKELTNSVANPYYVTIDPSSEEKLDSFEGATLIDDQPFIDFLRRSRDKVERYAALPTR